LGRESWGRRKEEIELVADVAVERKLPRESWRLKFPT
jgi:hypothetical protein